MKKYGVILSLAFSGINLSSSQALCSDSFPRDECKRMGNFRHHGAGIACLRYSKGASKEDLIHFIKHHLDTDIHRLDMSDQDSVDSEVIKELARSEKGGAIRFLDLMSTPTGYSGVVELWKSPTFGNLVNDSPTYERSTGTPLATIKIEIGHTRLLKQYKKRLFDYPLPLLENFEITYGHGGMGKSWKEIGYKQIKLLDHGEELEKVKKRPR